MLSVLALTTLYHKDLLLLPRKEYLPQLHPAKCLKRFNLHMQPQLDLELILTVQHGGLSTVPLPPIRRAQD